MKKLLIILLIAIVACETVEDIDFQSIWDKIKDTVEDAWDKLTDNLKDAINNLKNQGIYDLIKDKLVAYGKIATIALCTPYLTEPVCQIAVEALCQLLNIQ